MSATLKQVIVFQVHSSWETQTILIGSIEFMPVSVQMGSISWSDVVLNISYLAMQ